MDTVVDRLIRYAKVYSESDYHAGRAVTPSTDRQFDMARLLVEELRGLGIENARYDDKCYVYATLPATPGCEHLPAIGLIAHMDTTPDMTGKDVKPQIIHYTGGDVVLNREQNIVMEAAQFPELQKFVGQDLVCTDGTTLLGADDKAGIAIILQAVEELLAEKAPHGRICLGFTPDEEIGLGASAFDVAGFGADFAYTLDGGDITDYEYETFNAAKTVVTINGFSIHPGTSKDKMKNALLIAMEYNALLPALRRELMRIVGHIGVEDRRSAHHGDHLVEHHLTFLGQRSGKQQRESHGQYPFFQHLVLVSCYRLASFSLSIPPSGVSSVSTSDGFRLPPKIFTLPSSSARWSSSSSC